MQPAYLAPVEILYTYYILQNLGLLCLEMVGIGLELAKTRLSSCPGMVSQQHLSSRAGLLVPLLVPPTIVYLG